MITGDMIIFDVLKKYPNANLEEIFYNNGIVCFG